MLKGYVAVDEDMKNNHKTIINNRTIYPQFSLCVSPLLWSWMLSYNQKDKVMNTRSWNGVPPKSLWNNMTWQLRGHSFSTTELIRM